MTSLLYTILHYLRLFWNWLSNLFRGGGHSGGGGGGGISLASLNPFRTHTKKLITFDNGMQVTLGKQIAEGGFSYVFEAFGPNDPIAAASNAKVVAAMTMTMPSSSSSSNSPSSSPSSSSSIGRTSSGDFTAVKYALKRINCSDHELIQSCRHEAGIHRSLPADHPNLLTLLGLKFDSDQSLSSSALSSSSSSTASLGGHHNEYNVCYMLFPYMPYSLRGEITERNLLWDSIGMTTTTTTTNSNYKGRNYNDHGRRRRPFSTKEVLHLFGGIVDALVAMHHANISHRDVKLENILLEPQTLTRSTTKHNNNANRTTTTSASTTTIATRMTPVLMDFGSAGPLTVPLTTRSTVLTIIENAAQHTTMPYRPPELFEGGVRHCSSGNPNTTTFNNMKDEAILDYGKVDVWSLGCVLFGIMHGSSPFEMEFVRNNNNNSGSGAGGMEGLVKIVECTHLKILGEVPFPPWVVNSNSTTIGKDDSDAMDDGRSGKYPLKLYNFVRYMVNQDRLQRPSIHDVAKQLEGLYLELLGENWIRYRGRGTRVAGDDDDDVGDYAFDSLLTSRDFV